MSTVLNNAGYYLGFTLTTCLQPLNYVIDYDTFHLEEHPPTRVHPLPLRPVAFFTIKARNTGIRFWKNYSFATLIWQSAPVARSHTTEYRFYYKQVK